MGCSRDGLVWLCIMVVGRLYIPEEKKLKIYIGVVMATIISTLTLTIQANSGRTVLAGLGRLILDLEAGPQFVLCICEETMRAVARDKKKSSGFEQREYVLRFDQSEMPLLNKARVNNCVFIRHRRPGIRS